MLRTVFCESNNIEDILFTVLDETDISYDCCCTVETNSLLGDMSKSISMFFLDAITENRYQFHIFSELDSEALISFYYNDVYGKINSPNVVLKGILNSKYLYVVEERIEIDSLLDWLENSYDSFENGLLVLKKIACNLQILHSYKFVHADVSAKNILVDKNNGNEVWLIDFETVHQSGNIPRYYRGTSKYEGTEIGKEGIVTEKTDIQSLGYIINEFCLRKRNEMPKWLQEKMTELFSYCTNNSHPSIDKVVDDIQNLLNVCSLEAVFKEAKDIYAKAYQYKNTIEDDKKCLKYKKSCGVDGEVYFVCQDKSMIQNTYLVLTDKEIIREDYSKLSSRTSHEAVPTRKIYLDLIVFAWIYDEQRIAFVSRCEDDHDKFNIFRFNTVGVDKESFVNALNSIAHQRQSTVSELSLKEYYGEILEEISQAKISNHKEEKIYNRIKDIIIQQIG